MYSSYLHPLSLLRPVSSHQEEPEIMVRLNILVGGNFAFIASYLFNSVDKTLTLVRQNPTGPNPSWIERSVLNPSIL